MLMMIGQANLNKHGRIQGGNMKMRKINDGEILVKGDLIKMKSSIKSVPVVSLVGKAADNVTATYVSGGDFDGFYRPIQEEEKCAQQ
jgi:hypothetical protein